MRLPLQLAIILVICFAGEFLHKICKVPLPGNILSMLLLLAVLCLKIIKPEDISSATRFFLNHLPFFFLPASIGLLAAQGSLQGQWILLLILCISATIATMIATGRTVQFFERHFSKKEKK
ncbi:MAG: CidA/LrgA family protein [Fibrobacteraceae bacterium]|nr:CidA/LrgA family protein [Fibrobacteraceae bacterium]